MMSQFLRAIRTTYDVARSKRRTDLQRWSNPSNLRHWGDKRYVLLARLIPRTGIVLEFGAGEMTLASHPPPDCTYIPSDVVAQHPATFVCDLNDAVLPPCPRHDVAVFSGVLEYVYDIPRVLHWLAAQKTQTIVASYVPHVGSGFARKFRRRSRGWVNDFTDQEFQSLFHAAGFHSTVHQVALQQSLFRFERLNDNGGWND